MKQQDIAIVIVVVFCAAVISFFAASKVFSSSNKKQSAETVGAITKEFVIPDNSVLNSEAVNPTRRIEIAPNTNDQPFADQEQ